MQIDDGGSEPTALQMFQIALQHHQNGQLREAEHHYRLALARRPDYAEALNNLGNVLFALGRATEAEQCYRRTLELRPGSGVIYGNLGKALAGLGRDSEAEHSMRTAIELQPDYAEAHNDLGKLLQQRGLLDAAEQSYRRACMLNPALGAAHFNLGNLLFSFGRIEDAERSYRRAAELDPGHAEAQRNLLYMLNYVPGKHPAEIFAEHREFARRFVPVVQAPPHANSRIPGRRLRIGYVSGDLRDHAVAFFIEPVLAKHDRGAFEIFCYYNFPRTDSVTERLKSHAVHWRDVIQLDDQTLAAMVRHDQIDILVDLSGHTVYNRLLLFGQKPAPIQATWLGYLNTSGLDAMDYRITDAHATPAGRLDGFHVEKLVRLPDSQWCYRPPRDCPDVAPPPCTTQGQVTFASFANLSKISDQTIALWGRLLKRVPGSQLLVTSAILASIPDRYLDRFLHHGIAAERIRFLGYLPLPDYLALHREADIILDTFPYSGGTTSCHALWMGVPVVALAGDTATSRGCASLLHTVGLNELVAETEEQYLDIAATLASDSGRLAVLRAEMRARMRASPLMDERRFTRNLELAYREMWHSWCKQQRAA
jgi:predicted O-linked N-acetylglucosamine transferase (SPINDLY family)